MQYLKKTVLQALQDIHRFTAAMHAVAAINLNSDKWPVQKLVELIAEAVIRVNDVDVDPMQRAAMHVLEKKHQVNLDLLADILLGKALHLGVDQRDYLNSPDNGLKAA